MSHFYLYSPISIAPWGPKDLDTGIGGIETSLAEMAWRLQRKGHDVTIYACIEKESEEIMWRGVRWCHYNLARPEVDEGIWVVYRVPEFCKRVNKRSQVWFKVEDWQYNWSGDWVEHVDMFLFLCRTHINATLRDYPELKEKIVLTSHGVKIDLFEELEKEGLPTRNLKKIMYASSPDRGLLTLLQIFPRVQEIVPDIELHVFYGFNGIDDLIKRGNWPEQGRQATEELKRLITETDGVVFRGRVTQKTLYREWLTSAMMVYPTQFAELNFIAGQEAQCGGAIPIVCNVWAQGEKTGIGVKVSGDPTQTLVKAQYAAEICRLATDLEAQQEMRSTMIAQARKLFDWEKAVNQWDTLSTKKPLYRKTWNCRGCGEDRFETVVDLGRQAIATVFPTARMEVPAAPLAVIECQYCRLTQLSHSVNRDYLFRGEYGYRSGINETMRHHLQEVALGFTAKTGDIVVDIGCNDGTLLEVYRDKGITTVGFEPNQCCPKETEKSQIFINDFFSKDLYLAATGGKKAKFVFSLAMFYDLEDPTAFTKDIWDILDDNGEWIIEVQDSSQLIGLSAFDFICHEHVTNWDYDQLRYFLGKNKFYVGHQQHNSINGGSVLISAKKHRRVIDCAPSSLPWRWFGEKVKHQKDEFRKFLDSLRPARIWGYGASTKGNVLLQYYGLTARDIECIADRNPEKIGRYTPGTRIPIVTEEMARKAKPDYLLALPWGFIEGFRERERWAKFIVPFPEPAVFQPLGEGIIESLNEIDKILKEADA